MSIQVNFHIQASTCTLTPGIFICHIIASLYKSHPNMHIHTKNINSAEKLAKHLWCQPKARFIPHLVLPEHQTNPHILSIGYDDYFPEHCQTFINLTDQKISLENIQLEFKHLIEIVYNDDQLRKPLRQRYLEYRNQGYHVSTQPG